MKKICVVGAGAVGSFLGIQLALQGHQVSALARGETLASLNLHGWRLRSDGDEQRAPVRAVGKASELGVQDVVLIAVKGPALTTVVGEISALIGSDTLLVTAMNGVPWWFCKNQPGFEKPLHCIDPNGVIDHALPYAQVIGCVVHFSASTAAPGLTDRGLGNGLIFGEPSGGLSQRVEVLRELFAQAGFSVTSSDDIRNDIWYKLWGNITMNPISALTGATADQIAADKHVRNYCTTVMQEAAAIGSRIGCTVTETPEQRFAVAAKLGAFKTSMLQDVLSGRPIELDGIVTAVAEIGQRLGLRSPAIESLLGLTRLFARTHGLYPK